MSRSLGEKPDQLELPFDRSPSLRLIRGGGDRPKEPLASREAVTRVLLETGVSLLLRQISSARAQEINRKVEEILGLFDSVDEIPALMPSLDRELNDLEMLMRETRSLRKGSR